VKLYINIIPQIISIASILIVTLLLITGEESLASVSSEDVKMLSRNGGDTFGDTNMTTDQEISFTDVFNQARDSVVQIYIRWEDQSEDPSKGNDTILTGFVYDKYGRLITQNLFDRPYRSIEVAFNDGSIYSADLVAVDSNSDIGILQLEKRALLSQEKIKPLPLISNSSTVQIGEPVAIIGNPFGLSFSLATGVVSGMNRLVPDEISGFPLANAIQVEAIINGGGGGPVLDSDGNAVGLITSIIPGNNDTFTGINFAVPSNTIQKVVPQLIANGSYQHPYLGLVGSSITLDAARALGLDEPRGIIIQSVAAGSPADIAGLSNGTNSDTITIGNSDEKVNSDADIIIGIDNLQLGTFEDLINYINAKKSVGDPISLKVVRNGNIDNIELVLAERPNI
jgi:S1-C subfamily serine protease